MQNSRAVVFAKKKKKTYIKQINICKPPTQNFTKSIKVHMTFMLQFLSFIKLDTGLHFQCLFHHVHACGVTVFSALYLMIVCSVNTRE